MNINYFKKNVEIINESIFMEHMTNGCFPMTAHFGNWEILQRYSLLMNVSLNVIYNPLKNPYTNKLYLSQREVPQLPKGTNAMKQLIELIKNKKNIGVLVDQRDKLGEIFSFFNQEARTSTAIQRLCIKYNYKILPVKCERRKDNPNKFIITTFPPLEIEKSGNIEEDVKSLTNKTLEITESWIKQNPSHWMLWSYARWRTKF